MKHFPTVDALLACMHGCRSVRGGTRFQRLLLSRQPFPNAPIALIAKLWTSQVGAAHQQGTDWQSVMHGRCWLTDDLRKENSMKVRPWAPPLKFIPARLVRNLVEEALDQPRPTKELQSILQMILEVGKHRDRIRCGKHRDRIR